MFSVGPQYTKLKTNLRLAVNRLKLLEKKKTEQAQKARKEIADYISIQKEDRARIRVEHIIREDYIVEAYELLEMYCDLLIARFGLIQQMKEIDEGIEEAINSLLWAAPRVITDCQELKVISDQLTVKYGKPYAEACRVNKFGKVNPKLMHKLGVAAPPKILVEKYMIEIAKSHNVPFTPDENVMREDEVAAAEAMLIDFQNQGQQGGGWMYPQPPGVVPQQQPPPAYPNIDNDMTKSVPPPPMQPPVAPGHDMPGIPPQLPTLPGSAAPPPAASNNAAFNYPATKPSQEAGPLPPKVPQNPNPGQASAPPEFNLPTLPDPPADDFPKPPDSPPRGGEGGGASGGGGQGDDLDFDDLTRRFENLKKRR